MFFPSQKVKHVLKHVFFGMLFQTKIYGYRHEKKAYIFVGSSVFSSILDFVKYLHIQFQITSKKSVELFFNPKYYCDLLLLAPCPPTQINLPHEFCLSPCYVCCICIQIYPTIFQFLEIKKKYSKAISKQYLCIYPFLVDAPPP